MKIRYKIKAPDEKAYGKIQDRLRDKNVEIFLTSEKRLMISTGDIPSNVLSDIKEQGATVTTDFKYDLERKRA